MLRFILIILVFISSFSLFAQTEEVNRNLRLFAHGKIDEVKNNLLDLLVEYPNDPGVILLRGVVENNAFKALEIYERILEEHPNSEWADDAYWRIIQFHAIIGNSEKAEDELEIFRRRYPTSIFLGPATDVVRAANGIKGKNKNDIASFRDNSTKNEPIKKLPDNKKVIEDDDIVISNPHNEAVKKSQKEPNPDLRKTPMPEEPEEKDNENITEETENSDETGGYWGLQVGIYKNQNSAENERDKFLTKRLRTQVVEKEVNGETMYAVVIGNYTSKKSAEAAKMIVKQQCDCNPIIYKK